MSWIHLSVRSTHLRARGRKDRAFDHESERTGQTGARWRVSAWVRSRTRPRSVQRAQYPGHRTHRTQHRTRAAWGAAGRGALLRYRVWRDSGIRPSPIFGTRSAPPRHTHEMPAQAGGAAALLFAGLGRRAGDAGPDAPRRFTIAMRTGEGKCKNSHSRAHEGEKTNARGGHGGGENPSAADAEDLLDR